MTVKHSSCQTIVKDGTRARADPGAAYICPLDLGFAQNMHKPSLAAAICFFYYRHVNLRVRKHDRVAEELIPHEMKLHGTFKAQKITGNGNCLDTILFHALCKVM